MFLRCTATLVALLALHATSASSAPPPAVPDSIPPAPNAAAIRVEMENGDILLVERIQFLSNRRMRLVLLDGGEEFTWTNRVRSITDERGDDRTREVLHDERNLRVGGPESASRGRAPFGKRDLYLAVYGGAALPQGWLGDMSDNGYSLGGGIFMRMGRGQLLGIRADYTSTGSSPEVESFLVSASGGALDHMTNDLWGVSLVSRISFFPDAFLDPFMHLGLGLQSFGMSVSGPGASGGDAAPGLSLDLGAGLLCPLGRSTGGEILVRYTRAAPQDFAFKAGNVWVGNSEAVEVVAVQLGLVYQVKGGGR